MNRTVTSNALVFGTPSLLLLDSAIKGGVILAVAACVAVLLKRDSAATRHLVWLVAIVAMLVIPVFSAMLPQWRVACRGRWASTHRVITPKRMAVMNPWNTTDIRYAATINLDQCKSTVRFVTYSNKPSRIKYKLKSMQKVPQISSGTGEKNFAAADA